MKLIKFLLLVFLFSCSNDKTDYIHHDVLPLQEGDDRIYRIDSILRNSRIDVLFVVDNSGSMGPIQRNVANNATQFFQQFASNKIADWKIGIISTDDSERPYLGFDTSFDSSLIDIRDPGSFNRTVQTFQTAVESLGTWGSGWEYVFDNVDRVLDRYDGRGVPSFLRDSAHLVVIMITDEREQSRSTVTEFLNRSLQRISSRNKLRFYGALGLKDLRGCNRGQGNYATSRYKEIIDLTGGFHISACIPNFGAELAKIGKDFLRLVGLPSLLLRRRPKVETLRVYYNEEEIPHGPQSDGGFWYYEEHTNTINFYNLDFVEDLKNDAFRVEFDIFDGVDRDP